MTISKGEILLLEDTGTVATVIDGSEEDGWKCVNEGRGDVFVMSNVNALRDQATFGDAPSGAPAVGSFVTVFFSETSAPRENRWRVDGYATTPVFGASALLAVLTNASDPARSCYVDASQVFPV